jgi:hypothetical protein
MTQARVAQEIRPMARGSWTGSGVVLILAALPLWGAEPEQRAVALKAQPMRQVLDRLNRPSGTMLTVSKELADRRVTLVLPRGTAADARQKLAEHLGYTWTADGESRLRLEQTEERRGQPARLRAQRGRAARALLARRLRLAKGVLRGDAQAKKSLGALDRGTARTLAMGNARNREQVMQFLGEEDLQTLERRGLWMSRPLGFMPPDAIAIVRDWGYSGLRIFRREGEEKADEQLIKEAEAKANRSLAHRQILFQTYGEPDNPGLKGGLVNPLPLTHPAADESYRQPANYILLHPAALERLHAPMPLPFLDEPGKDSEDPALQRRVSLAYPNPKPGEQAHPTRLEDVLERLALATGMNVLADSYQSSRGDYLDWKTPLVDVPLWRALRRIKFDFWYDCEVKDGWLLFRHRRWPFEEEKELSHAMLAALDHEVEAAKGLTGGRLQALAQELKPSQFRNLKMLFPELRDTILPYHTLRIFGTLTPAQQQAASGSEGLLLEHLTAASSRHARTWTRLSSPTYASP